MKYEQAVEIVNKYLTGKRLAHSYGTAEVAYQIGLQLNCTDLEKLRVAALLHDIAKPLKLEKMDQVISQAGLELDFVTSNRALLHGSAAAAILQQEYDCQDSEILTSIRYHTTGHQNLGTFEQIIYAADFLDFKRSFPKQKIARAEMAVDFYQGLFYIARITIASLANKEKAIDFHTVEFYNHLQKIIEEENRLLRPVILQEKRG